MRSELLQQIQRYLNTPQTIHDFEAWVVTHLQDILDSGEKDIIRIIDDIDADLIQLQEGILDEGKLHTNLLLALNKLETIYSCDPETSLSPLIQSSSATQTFRLSIEAHPVTDLKWALQFA